MNAMELKEDEVMAWIHVQDGKTLLRVQKEITKTLEKHVGKEHKGKGGPRPKQLVQPTAWTDFTLLHAQKNGWESFAQTTSKKDKEGKKVTTYVTMPGSVLNEETGAHIFEGSITEKDVFGKGFTKTYAMCLANHYWSSKEKQGTREDLYKEFLEEFEMTNQAVVKEEPVKVTMSLEEKEAVKIAKKAAEVEKKQREKEAKEAEKKLLKAQEEEKKALEKELEKKEKDAALRAKQMAKIVRADQVEVKLTPPTPSKEVGKKEKKVKKVEKVEKVEWVVPEGNNANKWTYKGMAYYRDRENGVWKKSEEGTVWVGLYIEEEDRIDDEVKAPNNSDDEEEEEEVEEEEEKDE